MNRFPHRLATFFCCLALLEPVVGQVGKAAAPIKVAVVNFLEAASHTKAWKEGVARREKMGIAYNKSLGELSSQIEELDLDVKQMVPSEEQTEVLIKLEALTTRRKAAAKFYRRALSRQQAIDNIAVHKEISEAVAALSVERGISLVLRFHPANTAKEMVENKQVRTMNEAIQLQEDLNSRRVVIYHAKSLDLTPSVIKYLKK